MKTFLLTLIVSINLAVSAAAQGSVDIVSAYFGWNDHFADVTRQVRSLVRNTGVSFPVTLQTLGVDPAPGVPKVLRVTYRFNGQMEHGEWRENDVAQISPNGQRGGFLGDRRANRNALQITRAFYGAGNQVLDVTNMLQSRVAGNGLEFQVINANMGGDPAVNIPKTLLVNYEYQGHAYSVEVPENQFLRIPDPNAMGAYGAPAVVAAPPLRIVSAQYGQGNRVADVTGLLATRIVGGRLSSPIDNNSMGGDPAPGAPKQLYVIYEVNGERREARVNERTQLNIP